MLPGVERCGECGFAYDVSAAPWAGREIRAGAAELAAILTDGTAGLAARREPARWSPLEYGCHVRDMLVVQRERLLAARRLDRPVAEPMGRDERAELDGYAGQDPADVARQLGDAALLLAGDLARLGDPDWDRTLIYTYPERPSGPCAGSPCTPSTRCATTWPTSAASSPPGQRSRPASGKPDGSSRC